MPTDPRTPSIEDPDSQSRRMVRSALVWLKHGNHAPLPEIWQERIAEACVLFSEMMQAELLERIRHYEKIAQDALALKLPDPILISKGDPHD